MRALKRPARRALRRLAGYSPADLDRMRDAAAVLSATAGAYRPEERARTVEARLLTEIANGTDVEELEEHARAYFDRHFGRRSLSAP